MSDDAGTPATGSAASTVLGGHSRRSIWALIGVETLSFLGSEIARFGVSVWIYQSTQSVYAFEMLLLANTVPGLLVSPVAGALVDRHSRKLVMICAAITSLIGTLIVLAGASFEHLSMGTIVAGAMLASVGEAFQWPALSATIPLMATEEDLPRYNGFLESGRAASMLAGPVIGGVLFAFLHLVGLLAVEVVTFVTAMAIVSTLHIPNPEKGEQHEEEGSLFKESLFGMKWIYAHKPLLKFLCVAVFANFFLSIGMVLMPPYGLGLLSERSFGIANGLFGGGMIAGGILYGVLSKRFKDIQLFLYTALVMGVLYAGYGFVRGVVVLATINFLVAMLMTIGDAGIITIWQKKVPEEYQGRVLSAVRMIAFSTGPISYLLAGPLADQLAPFLFKDGGALAPLLVSAWGASKSSQIGFLFSVMGVIIFLGFVVATASRDVRTVEDDPAE